MQHTVHLAEDVGRGGNQMGLRDQRLHVCCHVEEPAQSCKSSLKQQQPVLDGVALSDVLLLCPWTQADKRRPRAWFCSKSLEMNVKLKCDVLKSRSEQESDVRHRSAQSPTHSNDVASSSV